MEKELQILGESLKQKSKILQAILQISKKQEEVLSASDPNLEMFDQMVNQKDQMIDKINTMDEGFESMYSRLSDGLQRNKDMYKEQISELQKLVGIVTGLSVEIQEQESKNKQLMDDFFMNQRKEIKSGRQNSKVALDYYKSMSNMAGISNRFMDSKQYRD